MSQNIALVTGATGFVGSHLVDELRARDRPVRALVRPTSASRRLREQGVEVVVADLTDPVAIGRALEGVDVVFHLAAATRARNEDDYRRANVGTTAALMDAVARTASRPRLISLGTLASVGPSFDGQPVGEDAEPRPLTAYGRTKLEAERLILTGGGLVLRPPAIYGPRDRDLFTFFRLARMGLMPTPAGGDRPVQMIHVRDVATALRTASESSVNGRIYNVAEPAIRPWSTVAQLIAEAVGRRAVRIPVPQPVLWLAASISEAGARLGGRSTIFNRDKVRELLAPAWICTTARAERELGFRASIPLEQGIPETAEWYRREGWLSA